MHPTQLPQQRVVPVVFLPPCPAGFRIRIHPEAPLAAADQPRALPSSAAYLCLLEWATSYTDNRATAYYLSTNRCRKHWLLWVHDWDDNWGRWTTLLRAYGPRRGVPMKTAAMHLLRAALAHEEARHRLGRFDWIAEDWHLEVPEILAVARAVWS
jgi:hypothetical protein